jgi:Family of unknown function (DUF6220)
MKVGHVLYRYWAVLLFLAVVLQVGLAGYGAFSTAGKVQDQGSILTHDQFEDAWGLHAGLGYGFVLAGLLLVAFALLARVGRPWTILCALLAALFVVQVLLAWIGFETAVVGALHPINALVIVGLSGFLARSAWMLSAPAAA